MLKIINYDNLNGAMLKGWELKSSLEVDDSEAFGVGYYRFELHKNIKGNNETIEIIVYRQKAKSKDDRYLVAAWITGTAGSNGGISNLYLTKDDIHLYPLKAFNNMIVDLEFRNNLIIL